VVVYCCFALRVIIGIRYWQEIRHANTLTDSLFLADSLFFAR
jgi:hypothetical protein